MMNVMNVGKCSTDAFLYFLYFVVVRVIKNRAWLVLVWLCCLGVLCLKCPIKVIENITRPSQNILRALRVEKVETTSAAKIALFAGFFLFIIIISINLHLKFKPFE